MRSRIVLLLVIVILLVYGVVGGNKKKRKASSHVHTMEVGQNDHHACSDILNQTKFVWYSMEYCVKSYTKHGNKGSRFHKCQGRLKKRYRRYCMRCTSRKRCTHFRRQLKHSINTFTKRPKGTHRDRSLPEALVCYTKGWPIAYNPRTTVCCGERLIGRSNMYNPRTTVCCGDKLMDSRTHRCCVEGTPVNRSTMCATTRSVFSSTEYHGTTLRVVDIVETETLDYPGEWAYSDSERLIIILASLVVICVTSFAVAFATIYKWRFLRRHTTDEGCESADVRSCTTETNSVSTTHPTSPIIKQNKLRPNNLELTCSEINPSSPICVLKQTNIKNRPCVTEPITVLNTYSHSTIAIQTDEIKQANRTNVMGKPYSCIHVFNKNNKTLQLTDSLVKLTLSEHDVKDRVLECHATTFRNAYDVHIFLQDLSPDIGCLASPMVEYYFPGVLRLREFASVHMEHTGVGQHIHVWKIETGDGEQPRLVEVPRRDSVNTDIMDTTHLDAYYETVRPGFVRIFVRTFSCLVCTSCADKKGYTCHNNFQIDASVFVNEEDTHLRLTIYLADPVFHLQDYKQAMRLRHGTSPKLERQYLNLPPAVNLQEDRLTIRLYGFPQSNGDTGWRCAHETCTEKEFRFSQITGCHEKNSTGLPFTYEWFLHVTPRRGSGNKSFLKFLIDSCSMFGYDDSVHPKHEPTKLIIIHELQNANLLKQAYMVKPQDPETHCVEPNETNESTNAATGIDETGSDVSTVVALDPTHTEHVNAEISRSPACYNEERSP